MKIFLFFICFLSLFLEAKDIYNIDNFPLLKEIVQQKKYAFMLDHKNTAEPFLNRFRVMKNLEVSGSSQFNEMGWLELKRKLEKYKPLEKVYVIDLREEPHFFIGGQSVTILKKSNKVNEHKFYPFLSIRYDKMLLFEEALIRQIKGNHKHYIYEILKKKEQEYKTHCVLTDDILTERQLVQDSGAHYLRFSVTDHRRPTDAQVDAFLRVLKEIPKNSWIHFHCRGGVGRTSTFILMLDIIQNGKKKSLDELVKINVNNGASKSLFSPNPCKKEKLVDAYKRKDFLINFYKFINDSNGYKGSCNNVTWSDWIRKIKVS